MSLIRAQDERDLLKKFLTDTDQRINTFLVRQLGIAPVELYANSELVHSFISLLRPG